MHANLRYFAPLPTHSDLCLSADRCTGIACIFTYTVHHSPTFSSLSPPTHATHGMRVSPNPRQQDSDKQFLRIAYHDMHNVLPAYTDIHSLTSRLSLSVYTDVHEITTPTRLPPVIRVTALPRAFVCHTHTVYYPTPLPRSSVSRVSLSCSTCDRISGYTPRARPRALTGLRLPAVGSPHTCFPGRTYGCP